MLERSHRPDLVRGVQLAVEAGTLEPLHALSASQKHSLLGELETRLGRARSRRAAGHLGASVVVRLTGSLDPTPPELLALERRHPVLPSR